MSILWFDNFKFDNTAGAIPATTWNAMDSTGSVNLTSTYSKNGFSNNGLDLSITTTGAATHGSYYANKMNVSPTTAKFSTGVLTSIVGFSVSQYPQSGNVTAEPPLLADMSVFNETSTRTAFSPDGSILAVFRLDASTNGYIDIYTRNGTGNTYTFSYNLITLASVSANSAANSLKFSDDSAYIALATTVSPFVYIFKRQSLISTTYTRLTSPLSGTAINGTPNTVHFTSDTNNLVLITNTTPYVIYYTRSGDAWTRTTDLSTVPNSQPLSSAVGLATIAGSQVSHLIVTTSSSPFLYDYSLTSGGSVLYNSAPGTALALSSTPSDVDISNQTLVVGIPSSPYMKSYNYTTASVIPTPSVIPTLTPTVKLSNDGRFLFLGSLGTSSPFQPITYKLVNNAWVNTSNNFPSVGVRTKTARYSADDNYFSFCSSSTGSQFIYTYDNQVNVIAVMSQNDTGAACADNYGYWGGSSRISLTLRDEIVNLRYYSGSTGAVGVASGIAGKEAGFADSTFTNGYFEFGVTAANQIILAVNDTQSVANWFLPSLHNIPTSEVSLFATAPISLTFKRDINSSNGTTLNCAMSDFYFLDANGLYYTKRLGPSVVDTSPLVSDATKQWTSNTGTTSYQILSNNPPDATKYVYTNVDGAYDTVNVDNSNVIPANAYASRVNVKVKTLTPSSNTVTVLNNDGSTGNQSVTTAFTNKDLYSELKSTYIGVARATDVPNASVYKFDVGTLTLTNIPLNGLLNQGVVRSITINPDGTNVAIGLPLAPYIQIFNRNLDQYNAINQSFPDITASSTLHTYSPDGKYLAVAVPTAGIIVIYTNSAGTYTKLTTLTLANTGTISSYKYLIFSKGGKYLFFGTTVANTSATFAIDSVNNTFTPITGVGTGPFYAADTLISPSGVEYIAVGNSTTLQIYRINNDNTFTSLVTSAAVGSSFVAISFVPNNNTTSVTIMVDLATGNSRNTTTFSYTNNTLAAFTQAATQLGSVQYNSAATYGFNSAVLTFSCNGTTLVYSGTTNGAYTNILSSTGGFTGMFAKDLYINSSVIGYRYNK